ncbi:GNAT family N-acetyltransferase [Arthrobacter sp. B6]|uniref:GNAT family N-acetyltransferase n=1 Tax=Arthrobacter sp. B6 TaxID=1570137 RepID=UPI000AF3AD5A|nr:GNAT family N-acetyltransferase [Arthrobacter sp. B6]
MANTALPDIERAMDAAWPAPDRDETGEWVLRAAGGVTQRANSIWPRPETHGRPHEKPALLRQARAWYRSRRLPVIFQVFDNARNEALNAFLDAEGFTRQSETVILVRDAGGDEPVPDAGVEISAGPSAEWLRLWWSVDGRGGEDSLATARGILEGCPSLYALVRDDDGVPAAVGRLAVPPRRQGAHGDWGGLYCMATRLDARRLGYGTRVLAALLQSGAAQRLDGYWLMVTAANSGARELYAKAGFREAGRYLYRQERPKRHLTGC